MIQQMNLIVGQILLIRHKINFRYIELMQTGDNLNYFKKYHQSAKIFKEYLETNGWLNIDRLEMMVLH